MTSLPITNQAPWLASRAPLFTALSFKNVGIILGPFLKIPLPKRQLALSFFRNLQQRRLLLCRFSHDQKKPQKAIHYFCPLWKSRWILCHFWQLHVQLLKIPWQKLNCFSELPQYFSNLNIILGVQPSSFLLQFNPLAAILTRAISNPCSCLQQNTIFEDSYVLSSPFPLEFSSVAWTAMGQPSFLLPFAWAVNTFLCSLWISASLVHSHEYFCRKMLKLIFMERS